MEGPENVVINEYWLYDGEDWIVGIIMPNDDRIIPVFMSKDCFDKYDIGDEWSNKIFGCGSLTDNNNYTKK